MSELDTCPGCKEEVDPSVCWCGTDTKHHTAYDHPGPFVPMGCRCMMEDSDAS